MNSADPSTPREAVRAALAGRAPDRLLCGELVLDLDLVREALGLAADAAVPLDAEKALLTRWGHDLVTVSFSHGWGAEDQPDEEDARFRLDFWQQNSDLFVFALIDGPFSIAVKAWGWQDALINFTRGHPDLEMLMADAVVELHAHLAAIAEAGADGIIIGEDIAMRSGPSIRPEHLKKRYFPYLNLLVLAAQDLGLPVVYHSDGNLWPIWDDLRKTGIDGVQGIDPYSAMSMALARERSGPALCLWGNLDLGWLAQAHDAVAISAHLHDLLDPLTATPTIFGTCSGLAPGLPLPNLDAVYSAAQAMAWSGTAKTRIETRMTGF